MKKVLVLALAVCSLSGFASSASAEPIYALSAQVSPQFLFTFDSATPGTTTSVAITGLQTGETLAAIDLRPANGVLYGLGTTSRLYTINSVTGAATAVNGPFTPALVGTSFGFDFNPTVDRIRVVSDADQNVRLNPDTGLVVGIDVNLSYGPSDPNLKTNPTDVAAAYTNNFAGAASTTLYGIDSNLDILFTQGSPTGTPISPNTGQLFTVGALGINTDTRVGFDISGITTIAYASLTVSNVSGLYTINLATGAATLIGNIGAGITITDITAAGQGPVTPSPTPIATLTATPTITATATATPTTVPATATPTISGGGGGPTANVPTLSGWAMLALALSLAATGWLFIRGGSPGGS